MILQASITWEPSGEAFTIKSSYLWLIISDVLKITLNRPRNVLGGWRNFTSAIFRPFGTHYLFLIKEFWVSDENTDLT